MQTVKQLSKLTESLSAVKAQLDKEIVGLKEILTTLTSDSMVSKIDPIVRIREYEDSIRSNFSVDSMLQVPPSYAASNGEDISSVFQIWLLIPERIRNYRRFALMTQTGPQAARIASYGASLDTMTAWELKTGSCGNLPEFKQRLSSFVNNQVVLDTICEISSKIVPHLQDCDVQYWHSPLLEPVFTLCNGILRSIGIEYFESKTYYDGEDSDLPQYLGYLECCNDSSYETACFLTIVDAIQLRLVVDELIRLFAYISETKMLEDEDR